MFVFSKNIQARILEGVCCLFVLLFVYAAVSKLLDFNTFRNQLGQSPILSAYAHWVVWLVPFVEILVAIALVIPRFRIVGLYAFFGIMLMFTTYISIVLNFADFVPCSCGGILEKLGWTEHLVFNLVFVALAVFAIFIYSIANNLQLKNIGWKLLGLAIFSTAVVTLLFISSEKQIKRNNAFIRKYIPHPIKKIGEYDLEYNSYYLAGMDDETIYLGNYTTPLTMITLDIPSGQFEEFRIKIDSMHLPYRRVRISVEPPYFYVGDGTVPVLFRGKTNTWKASMYSHKDAYFTQFVVSDSSHIGIATMSGVTKANVLGLLHRTNDTINLHLNTNILTKHTGNRFASDGLLLWNKTHQQFIYTYFYRNRYEIIDKTMSSIQTGKTIDTISKAVLDVAHHTTKDYFKLGGKSIMVNQQAATYGNYLYIHSDRLGKYEDEKILRSASIIDVYHITNNTYAFSFYLFHQQGKKLTEYKIYKDMLVAIIDDRLWIYRLKPEYFNPGLKATHTAQYQEEGRTPVEKSRPLIQ